MFNFNLFHKYFLLKINTLRGLTITLLVCCCQIISYVPAWLLLHCISDIIGVQERREDCSVGVTDESL